MKTLKFAKLICWAKTPIDSRHTADGVMTLEVPQCDALRLAREIDTHGSAATLPAAVCEQLAMPHRRDWTLAPGHGVTIRYASGRTREVEAMCTDVRESLATAIAAAGGEKA